MTKARFAGSESRIPDSESRGVLLALAEFALMLLLLAGCAGSSLIGPPRDGEPGARLPLRTVWVRQLLPNWTEDLFRPMEYAAPTVADGVVFLGDNENRFYAFRETTGDIVWKFETYGPVECAAVVVGDLVIFGDGDGYVYGLNRRTGLAKWTYRVQGQVLGRLVSDGKLVFLRTNHERVYAVSAADGKWKWMQSREQPPGFTIRDVSGPTVDRGRVLIGYSDGYFMAYNTADGVEIFKTMLEKGERFVDVDSTPVIDGDSIYVASYSGSVYSLSRETASMQWVFSKGSVQRVAVVGDRLFLSDIEGFLRAVDKQTGKEIWNFDLREYDLKRSVAEGPRRRIVVPTNPVPYHDVVLVASSTGYLYAIGQKDGQVKWQFWPGFGVTAELVVDGDNIFLHTNFGNVYCLKPNSLFYEPRYY